MSTCNGMVFELNGARALSDFRAARVLAALQRVSSNIEAVSGRFVHFVHASRELTKAEEERLASLLTYGDAAEDVRADLAFMVVPRLGTISPWASKAVGHREELRHRRRPARRARHGLHSLALKAPLTEEEAAQAAGVLHDRMTESVGRPPDFPVREPLCRSRRVVRWKRSPLVELRAVRRLNEANVGHGSCALSRR